MVDPKLLEILVCPETHQPVRPAEGELLDRLNQAIRSGGVTNRGGQEVADPVEEGPCAGGRQDPVSGSGGYSDHVDRRGHRARQAALTVQPKPTVRLNPQSGRNPRLTR